MRQRATRLLTVLAVSWALATSPATAQESRSAELLAAEISGLMQAARAVRDPRDRGRLWYLASLKLERIRTAFPRSAVAAELAFGRYGEIDAGAIDQEAKAWLTLNAAEAESLRRGETTVSVASTAGSSLVPNFGRGAGGAPPRALPLTDPAPQGGAAIPPSGRSMSNVQLTERLRQTAVFIYVPGKGSGSGFFVSPTHILTNTHVVEGAQRVVVANRAIGIRAARVLALGKTKDVGPDTAVLQVDGAPAQTFLSFAAGVTEGENIAIAGYPGSASQQDRSYVNFFELILQNRLPSIDNIPSAKYDFGFLQSIFIHTDSGIENVQVGLNTAPGNSGSPIVNHCGEVVAQHYLGVSTPSAATKFNFAISLKELTKFLASTNAPFVVSRNACST